MKKAGHASAGEDAEALGPAAPTLDVRPYPLRAEPVTIPRPSNFSPEAKACGPQSMCEDACRSTILSGPNQKARHTTITSRKGKSSDIHTSGFCTALKLSGATHNMNGSNEQHRGRNRVQICPLCDPLYIKFGTDTTNLSF